MFIYTIFNVRSQSFAEPKICPLPWPERGNLGMLFLDHCAANPELQLLLVMFLPNKKPCTIVQPIEHRELMDFDLDRIESRARVLVGEASTQI